MVSVARYAYAIVAFAFVIGLAVQVFLAGMGLFVDRIAAGGPNFSLHVDLGWALHLAPVLVLLAAVLSRAGRRHWIWALVMTVVVFIVPLVVLARADMPAVAALHPVLAMVAFGLAAMVARNSLIALRDLRSDGETDGKVSAAPG